jgi:hypothetical protein
MILPLMDEGSRFLYRLVPNHPIRSVQAIGEAPRRCARPGGEQTGGSSQQVTSNPPVHPKNLDEQESA